MIRGTSPARIAGTVLAALTASRGVCAGGSGALEFRVTDRDSRAPIESAVVLVSADGAHRAVTDAGGVARIDGLPAPSTVEARIEAAGYVTVRLPGIDVDDGAVRVVPVALPRARAEAVTVRGERPGVALEETAPATRFSGDFLEDLPILGRDVQAMLPLAPGVQDSDGDGNPNVHGARERDFKLMIGDVSNQDPLSGLFLGYVNPDTIEDLEVFPVGAGAEFGRAQGGFARVIQKQGGNSLDGVAGFAFRSSRLDGNGATNTPAERAPRFESLLPFLQISGPIVRDRLWYRLSAEYRREDEPLVVPGVIDVATHRQTIEDGELSWQASARTKLSVHLRHDPYSDSNVGISATRPSDAAWKLDFRGTTYALSTASVFSPRVLFETTTAVQRYEERTSPMTRGLNNDCVFGYDFINAAQCFSAESNTYSGSYNVDRTDTRRRFTTLAKVAWAAPRFLGADHQVRAGASVESERFTRRTDSRPFLSFEVVKPNPIDTGNGTVLIPEPFGLAATSIDVPFRSERTARGSTLSVWAEDQIRPRSNLAITVGLRYDREEISALGYEPFDPREENRRWREISTGDPQLDLILIRDVFTRYEGLDAIPHLLAPLVGFTPPLSATAQQTAFWNVTRRPEDFQLVNGVLAPRLSVSWDPFADGRTKIALTAGRYYDKTFLAVPLVESDPAVVSLLYTAFEYQGVWYITEFTGTVNPGLTIRQVDRKLRPPHQDEISLALEREIAPELLLRVVGISRRFEDQFQDVDLNRDVGDEGVCAVQYRARDRYVQPSPGSGFELTDIYTGETYVDTDPGDGDGRLDDCAGRLVLGYGLGDFRPGLFPRPDGRPDLYLQNPAWGSVLRVGNTNRARYHAVVVELVRRMRRNWQMEGSYTWSRAIGEAEDFLQTLGNDRAIVDDERGFLSYDQRHVVKVNAAAITPWGIRLGVAATWQSGLPYSSVRQTTSYTSIVPTLVSLQPPDPTLRTVYVEGGRNSRRNRSYWNFDVQAVREFRTRGDGSVRLTAEIFNLLNDGTYIVYSPALKYGQRFFGTDEAYRRFGRRFQLGVRVAF